eukprot:9913936-Lingulodinium_polyedra.AAC.1
MSTSRHSHPTARSVAARPSSLRSGPENRCKAKGRPEAPGACGPGAATSPGRLPRGTLEVAGLEVSTGAG